MRIAKFVLAAGIVAACVGVAACDKDREEMRPDMDKVVSGERGLQSRDLREMTDRMAPDLLQIPQISQNPNRVTIVMKPVKNMTESSQGEDMTIFVARLKALLQQHANDRVAFVMEQKDLRQVQNEELGSPDPMEDAAKGGQAPDQRQLPQYELTGTIYEKWEGKTSYYLCTFDLNDIHTGVNVWEGHYETKTLNEF